MIEYKSKKDKNGKNYYLKIDNNGKKKRISKKEYMENKEGGGKRKRSSKTETKKEILQKKCFNFIQGEYIEIDKFLGKNRGNFVIRRRNSARSKKYTYTCYNISEFKTFLEEEHSYFDVPKFTIPNQTGEKVARYYDEKYNIPNYLKRRLNLVGKRYDDICNKDIKLQKILFECKGPSLLSVPTNFVHTNNRYVVLEDKTHIEYPEFLDFKSFKKGLSKKKRVFDLITTGRKIRYLASESYIYEANPNAVSRDHCNQKQAIEIYRLVQHERDNLPNIGEQPNSKYSNSIGTLVNSRNSDYTDSYSASSEDNNNNNNNSDPFNLTSLRTTNRTQYRTRSNTNDSSNDSPTIMTSLSTPTAPRRQRQRSRLNNNELTYVPLAISTDLMRTPPRGTRRSPRESTIISPPTRNNRGSPIPPPPPIFNDNLQSINEPTSELPGFILESARRANNGRGRGNGSGRRNNRRVRRRYNRF